MRSHSASPQSVAGPCTSRPTRNASIYPWDRIRAMSTVPAVATDRQYLLERVGEAAVVQLYADGFRDLPLRDKLLMWHLTRAAIAGRDIFYDQRYAHNLEMRDVLEGLVTHADIDAATLDEIRRYTKLFWL